MFKFWKKIILLTSFICFLNNYLLAQFSNAPVTPFNQNRLKTVVITEAAITTIGFIGLHYLWYKKFPHSRFHLFNDNSEWLQMDKVGHLTTAYTFSSVQYNAMRMCGLKNNQAIWIGGLTGLGVQTIIEIFDGFSSEWGFSKGDMLANIIGTTLFMGQQFAFNQQRVQLKFSFHHTLFAKYNPGVLGDNKWQRWIKDYNGQTYWASVNIASFLKTNTNFPKWLNASIGYGASGMTSATNNLTTLNGKKIPSFKRERKYFFSVDADLIELGKPNPYVSTWLTIPELIKIPAPAIEFSKTTSAKVHWVYF